MKMRHLSAAVISAAMLAGCAGNEHADSNADAARQSATEAAARLVAVNHSDTLAMQHAILDARAVAGQYQLAGDTAAVRAFDEAFEQYLAQHDTALHDAIFNSQSDQ